MYDYKFEMMANIGDVFGEYDEFASILNDYDETQAKDVLAERMHDVLFTEDSVTGNGSGSYFFNSAKSKEVVEENLGLLGKALDERGWPEYEDLFGELLYEADEDEKEELEYLSEIEQVLLVKGGEWCDVTIRCHLLYEAILCFLDENLEDLWEEAQAV